MRLIVILIVFSFIFSCKENTAEKNSKNDQVKKYTEIKDRLVEQYNVNYSFDTITGIKHSIDFVHLLPTENQILSNFIIVDIYKKDNNYFIKIEKMAGYNTFYFEISLNKENLNKIRKFTTFDDLRDKEYYKNDLLIVKTQNIKKIDFQLEGELNEFDNMDDYSIDLNISSIFNGRFFCKGEFVDYIKVDL